MIIVGISGKIGSGKSTLADLLCHVEPALSVHLETSTVVTELANKFNSLLPSADSFDYSLEATNRVLSEFIHYLSPIAGRSIVLSEVELDIDEVTNQPDWYEKLFIYYKRVRSTPSLADTTISTENKSDYRDLLQWIGGYFLHRIEPTLWYQELNRRITYAGSDISFAALTAVRQPAEAHYIQSIGGLVISIQRPENDTDTTDVTERHVKEILDDINILNDGTLQQLDALTKRLYTDLKSGKYLNKYTASDF